jgi:hypothetical protein
MTRTLLVLCLNFALLTGLVADASQSSRAKSVDSGWHTGSKLDLALQQPVIATWQNAELRTALRALGEQRRVAIVLDRRLNPNHQFSLETNQETLRDVLGTLAESVDGHLSVTEQFVYIGPLNATSKLRTLLSLRNEDMLRSIEKLTGARKSALTNAKPLQWKDLDAPADIVKQLVHERDPKLGLTGLELIPHDLWAMGEIPQVNLPQALSILLIQFDLTFRFSAQGTGLEIVQIPEIVAMERRFPLPKAKAAEISKAVKLEAPKVDTQATPEQLIATGTQEQLEELERIIRSLSSGTSTVKKKSAPTALAKRRITFQARDVPLKAILDKLATTGIQFEYDADALKSQGINIEQLVEIDVTDVTLNEFFEELFAAAGLDYDIQGVTVRLTIGKQVEECEMSRRMLSADNCLH